MVISPEEPPFVMVAAVPVSDKYFDDANLNVLSVSLMTYHVLCAEKLTLTPLTLNANGVVCVFDATRIILPVLRS